MTRRRAFKPFKSSLRTLSITTTALCFWAVISIFSYAQTTTLGAISGTITDPSSASVPNATVTVTNQSTNVVGKATNTSKGYHRREPVARPYSISGIPATNSSLHLNIWGYTFGGPLYIPKVYNTARTKTFFFAGGEWKTDHYASVLNSRSMFTPAPWSYRDSTILPSWLLG